MNRHSIPAFAVTLIAAVALLGACGDAGREGAAPLQKVLGRGGAELTDSIMRLAFEDPYRALDVINRCDSVDSLSACNADALRVLVYHDVLQNRPMAQFFALRVHDSQDYKECTPIDYTTNNHNIVEQYISTGDWDEALTYVQETLHLADSLGSWLNAAQAHYYRSQICFNTGDTLQGLADMRSSLADLDRVAGTEQNWRAAQNRAAIIMNFISMLGDHGLTARTDTLLPLMQSSVAKMCAWPDVEPVAVDMMQASMLGTLIDTGIRRGRTDSLDLWYSHLQELPFARSPLGVGLQVPYLIYKGDYAAADRLLTEALNLLDSQGSGTSYEALELLRLQLETLERCGAPAPRSLEVANKIIALSDSLSLDRARENAATIATLYRVEERERAYAAQRADLSRLRVTVVAVTVIVVLILLLLWRVWAYNRTLTRKNRAAARMIDEMLDRSGGAPPRPATATPLTAGREGAAPLQTTDDDRLLFNRLRRKIIEEKMYLNPDLTRDELIRLCNIPAYRFARLFETCAGMPYKEYIASLRLEEAARMLREQPNLTIEAVAADCGYQSKVTFYRRFADRFGLTPAQYRAARP